MFEPFKQEKLIDAITVVLASLLPYTSTTDNNKIEKSKILITKYSNYVIENQTREEKIAEMKLKIRQLENDIEDITMGR